MTRLLIAIGLLSVVLLPSFAAAANSRTSPPTPRGRVIVSHMREHRGRLPAIPIPLTPISISSDSEECLLIWAMWWGSYSNATLIDVSSNLDKMQGIARFVTGYKGVNGLTIMRQIPIMVPNTTVQVLINGGAIPRDPERQFATTCIPAFTKQPAL